MSFSNLEAGRYSIDLINNEAGTIENRVVNMSYAIPQQRLRLRGYRVEFDTQANALAAGVLYFDITDSNNKSILSYNHLIDNNSNRLLFSLPLDNAVVTNKDSLNKVLYLSSKVDSILKVSVYNNTFTGFALDSNIVRFYVDFETELGSLG